MNQPQFDQLMWGALQGALGTRKTATLKNSSLSDLLTAKIANEGVAMAGRMTLGTAVGVAGMKIAYAHDEARAIEAGIDALHTLQGTDKTASASQDVTPGLYEKIAHAYKLQTVAPYVSEAMRAEVKLAFDAAALDVYDYLRKLGGALQGISKKDSPAATLAEESDKVTQDVSNIPLLEESMQSADKQASAGAYEDFLASVYLDNALRGPVAIEKVAEVRAINREYGMQLLYQVLK